MDKSLLIAILLFITSCSYVIYKFVKSYLDINIIKNKKAKVTIERWDGRKYTVNTNSKKTKDLLESAETFLHN